MGVNTTFTARDLNQVAFMLDALEDIDNAITSVAASEVEHRTYMAIGTVIPVSIGGLHEAGDYYGSLVKDDQGSWVFQPASPLVLPDQLAIGGHTLLPCTTDCF